MKKRIVYCMVMALMLTGCSKGNSGASEPAESADSVSTEVITESSVEATESDSVPDEDPEGVYARICTRENYEGNDVLEREFIYCLRGDGTGIMRNDVCYQIRWADGKLYAEQCGDVQTYEYKLEGDVLKVKEGDTWEEYTKKPGDDIVENGDLSEFAGKYKATDESKSAYGDLRDIEIDKGGMINEDGFPSIWPSKVTKNEDGSYLCEYDNYEFEYTIYPESVIDERDASNTDLLENVYIRAVKKGDDAMEAVYYRTMIK